MPQTVCPAVDAPSVRIPGPLGRMGRGPLEPGRVGPGPVGHCPIGYCLVGPGLIRGIGTAALVAALVGAAPTMPPVAAVAADGYLGSTPWTTVPRRIDRSAETRERLPGRDRGGDGGGPAGEIAISVDEFPRIDAEGGFRAGGRRFRFADVTPPRGEGLCTTADGRRWNCGLRARARFSAVLAGARLVCDAERSDRDAGVLAGCRIRGRAVADLVRVPDEPDAEETTGRTPLPSTGTDAGTRAADDGAAPTTATDGGEGAKAGTDLRGPVDQGF